MKADMKLRISLLSLRLGVSTVMLVWTADKFLRPQHAAAVFENFYFLSDVSHTVLYTVALAQLLVVLAFMGGVLKKFSYLAILILHGVSTLSSFKQYFSPFDGPNILFFAAWPMLAACLALYLLKDEDDLLAFGS